VSGHTFLFKSVVTLNEGFSYYLRSSFEIFISLVTTKMPRLEKMVGFKILYFGQNY